MERTVKAKIIAGLGMAMAVAAATADHDFLRPLNIEMTAPDASVPPTCARFYSDTGWGNGAWDQTRRHELFVTRVDFDCNVEALYGYGSWNHDGTGGWLALSGTIVGNTLVLPIDIFAADAEYEFDAATRSLRGRFTSRDGTRRSEVVLTPL